MKGDIKVITCGCRFNRYESEEIKSRLSSNVTQNGNDIVVINTCAVTKKSEAKSRHAVRRAVRENPKATIAVAGCWAEYDPKAAESIEGVDYVLGNEEKFLPDAIHPNGSNTRVGMVEEAENFIETNETGVGFMANRTAAYLKIQNGCNESCSFCMVRMVRGKSRSASPEFVIKRIDDLVSNGAKEIVLTGINIGEYGADLADLKNGAGLAFVLTEAAKRKSSRFRLSSINPAEITDEVVNAIAESDNICRHLHVPMQSGSDDILQKMRRPYTSAQYGEKIISIAKIIPGIGIGCDVMAGFPTETDDDFRKTADMLSSLPFSYAHVFPYSPRQKTAAYEMADTIPPHVKKERVAELKRIAAQKNLAFRRSMLDKQCEVLVETRDAPGDKLRGKSDTFVNVEFVGAEQLKRKTVAVVVKAVTEDGVFGELRGELK